MKVSVPHVHDAIGVARLIPAQEHAQPQCSIRARGSAAGYIRLPSGSRLPQFSKTVSDINAFYRSCVIRDDMALVEQNLSKTAIDFEFRLSNQALAELYEAYQAFCAYGTHPTSWRSLAVQLQLYLETNPTFGPLSGFERRTFTQVLSRLDTEQFAYLISDALLALFRLSAVLPQDHDLGLCGLHVRKEEIYRSPTSPLRSGNLPAYLSRRYLHEIGKSELVALLLSIRQEIQIRTASTYFAVYCDQSWSPASGSYPSILLYCDIQLPLDDSDALLAYSLQHGTYFNNEHIVEKPKGRTELRSALLSFPRRLIRATTLSPREPVPQPQGPGLTPARRDSVAEDNLDHSQESPHIVWPSKAFTLGGKKGQTATRTNRARALSLDSFTKKDLIPSTRGAFEALWRRRRVVSWPSNLSSKESTISNKPTQGQGPWDMSFSQRQGLDVSQPLEPLLEDPNLTIETTACDDLDCQERAMCFPSSHSLSKSATESDRIAESVTDLHDEGVDVSFDNALDPTGCDKSCSSTHQSFVTADTHHPSSRRHQTREENNRDSVTSCDTFGSLNDGSPELTGYLQLLQRCDLIPEPFIETNWSGRGQHAEFACEERDLIPLEQEEILGRTQTALVESVRCKRVRLVRKTIRCNRRTGIKREEAVLEVQHLYRAQHSHIVRLVGTYVVEDDLAILTYPCAEWDLQRFMSTTATASDSLHRASSLRKFFTCLANVLDFIHSCPIKHMDLKPQNILVRDIRNSAINDSDPFKVYITDFGISRSYTSVEACDTETPTSFTRAYAAREVVLQESRGLAADIFSLGCVYAEMLATLLDISFVPDVSTAEGRPTFWDSLRSARTDPEYGIRPYHSALSNVRSWIQGLPILDSELTAVRGWILRMMDHESVERPTARQIADDPHLPFSCLSCSLRSGPEDFEVARPIKILPEHPP